MKVLIVDDEQLARDRLARMLTDMNGYEVVGQAANGMQAIERCESTQPDVVLLDIRMPGMDGLEAARHMAGMEQPPAVVFCTAYEEHAIEAFKVQAVGYLLKPVRRDDLSAVLASATRTNRAQLAALAQEEGSQRTHISARTRKGIELVPVDEVRYFQADQKYVTMRHPGGELLIDETLQELETEFGSRFIRVHRNALVATKYIEGLERNDEGQYQIRLRDVPTGIDISRRHVSSIRRYIQKL
ncbi:MAG TPA: LytTR family DNA-binding domain-containing protein [Pseudomonadales bacterium]|nr:LytTR family DNA-binding domain-containing protein [Pseudomonadales bacterium]